MKHYYSLKQWRTIANLMIYKEKGKCKVHRLRVISLCEADLNFCWVSIEEQQCRNPETKKHYIQANTEEFPAEKHRPSPYWKK